MDVRCLVSAVREFQQQFLYDFHFLAFSSICLNGLIGRITSGLWNES